MLLLSLPAAQAQYTFQASVKDKATGRPIPGVTVADKHGHGGATNDSGKVIITNINVSLDTFFFDIIGYKTSSLAIDLHENTWHEVVLFENSKEPYEAAFISTPSIKHIEVAPIVVCLGNEEIEDENAVSPANIASILGEVSGVLLQQSSATSGNMNVRILGLGGQYTQIVKDGMPLYNGFSGGFGILQIPPLDLGHVELIKGSATTLYGGGAIAGLVSLISKGPSDEQEATFTINATTLQEQNVNAYVAKHIGRFGYTFFAGYNHQNAVGVNGDGLSDAPLLNSFTIHPRLFFYPDEKTTITAGYSGTFERRYGGDIQVIDALSDSTHQYFEKDLMQRNTGEFIFERSLPGSVKLTVKGSISSFSRDIATNIDDIKANQVNYYSEASMFIPQKENSIVAGINVTGDHFKKLPGGDSIALNDFRNNVIGAFAQYTLHLPAQATLEAGLRGDHTDHYGNFVLPSIALFHRFNDIWAMRAGLGFGYKIPNPLDVQIIDYPTQDLLPLASNIKAETSQGYNLEGDFKKNLGHDINLFVSHAFFLTQINSPVIATQAADQAVSFANGDKPIVTFGFDTYVKLTVEKLELYLAYTYTDAERKYLDHDQFMPLTPRHRVIFTAVRQIKEKWRVGIKGSFIDVEYRDGDVNTQPYVLASVMIERKLGKKFSIVLNGKNLFDYRQTRFEQIYGGSITNPTFKPLWAPIDGRVINFSVRITPFAK